MVRLLIMVCILFSATTAVAQVSAPVREIQIQIRSDKITDILNSGGPIQYSGIHSICGGGHVTLTIHRADINTHGFMVPTDGRHGVQIDVNVNGDLDFQGDGFCSYTGGVICTSTARAVGPLFPDSPVRGQCRSPTLGILTAGFGLTSLPPLYEDGVTVKLPDCQINKTEMSCLRWAELGPGGYAETDDPMRIVRFAGRFAGLPMKSATDDSPLQDATGGQVITLDAHVGARADLVAARTDLPIAANYVSPPLPDGADFRAMVSLDALTDLVSSDGKLIDKGVFSQMFPAAISGRGHISIVPISYEVYLDNFALYRALVKNRETLVIEGNAYTASLKLWPGKANGGLRLPLFKRLRARIIVDSVRTDPDGRISLLVEGSELYAKSVFGLFEVKIGGNLLNTQLSNLLQTAPLAQMKKNFELGIPRCIFLEKNPSQNQETCTGIGAIKHVAGYRGAAVSLAVATVHFNPELRSAEIVGSTQVAPLRPETP